MLWILLFIVLILLIQVGISSIHLSAHKEYRTKQQEKFIKDARRLMKGKDIDA